MEGKQSNRQQSRAVSHISIIDYLSTKYRRINWKGNNQIDNIFVEFGGRIFQQIIGIPIGTNCAPLHAALFLYLYEAHFVQKKR